MKIKLEVELEVSEKNEITNCPYWLVIDPEQMMKPTIHSVARMIKGPFFSREEAESYVKCNHYNFSDRVGVYCHAGHNSPQYMNACNKALGKDKRYG